MLNDNMITRIQSINTTRDYHQFKPEEARPATRSVALKPIVCFQGHIQKFVRGGFCLIKTRGANKSLGAKQ